MKTAKLLLLCSMLVLLAATDGNSQGEKYYTRCNIWYEQPEKIYSTNYHRGTILPAGTPVTSVALGKKKIRFTIASGAAFEILHNEKHNPITLQQLQDRYFSKENVMAKGGKFYKFTNNEQTNIKKGAIVQGMSKDAVVMAYGNPPEHKTPTLSNNVWTYWENRFVTVVVHFGNDNRVSEIAR